MNKLDKERNDRIEEEANFFGGIIKEDDFGRKSVRIPGYQRFILLDRSGFYAVMYIQGNYMLNDNKGIFDAMQAKFLGLD